MARAPALLHLTRTAAAAVRRGHPWVWREGIAGAPRGLASGAVVELEAEGRPIAHGLWDAGSPIAVRVLGPGRAGDVEHTLLERLDSALKLRDRLFPDPADTDAYRLCNGEGDRFPGLHVDRYATVAIARLDGEHLAGWIDRVAPHLAERLERRGITSLGLRIEAPPSRAGKPGAKVRTLAGEEVPERIVVRERGMRMEVDLWHGQKTGAFLDQRENRARVRRLAKGARRVLNLFSYAGGFSLAAALAGAEHVTSVDIASGAHASAQRTFRANGLDPTKYAFVAADVLDYLERARDRGERFDLVISDPPSFAPSEKARPRALAAYRKLHAAATSVLAPGGTFCAASCSSHVSLEDFLATLADGWDLSLRVLEVHGQPADHPSVPTWPEGRYLKFVVLG